MAVASATRVGPKFQVTIPQAVRRACGLKVGDWVEAQAEQDGTIRLKRKRLLYYDAELEAALEEAEADVRAGRVFGPFDSVAQVRRALKECKARMAAGDMRGTKRSAQRAVKRLTHARASN